MKTFKGKKALVVGDLMLDKYIWGNIKRISPEAPVPIVKIQNRTHVCGGAGNVAINLASLGATVFLQGIVGDDTEAENIFKLLQETGIEGQSVISAKGRPTSTKVRIIAQGRQVARLDSECELEIGEEHQNLLVSRVEETIQHCDVAILSDYAKGVLTPAVCQKIIASARAHSKPIIVDPKGIEWTKYRGSTVVTPNVKEAEVVWGHKIGNEDDLRAAGNFLVETLGGADIIITLGPLGMRVFSSGSESFHIPATTQNVFDVTGAGDTAVAVLSLALASGYSLVESARLANAGAGVVVGKIGTASLTAVELFDSDN